MTEAIHILVVEDDPLVSEVIAATLDDDYRTTVVGSATDALDHLRGGDIRLMLLDCTLPGGVDANLIPAADQAGVAVILMSGDRARIDKFAGSGRPFVLKPFTLVGLLTAVEQVLSANG